MNAIRDSRAEAITADQIARIVASLEGGASLERACTEVGVLVADFRWRRYSSPLLERRVTVARVRGLRHRAAYHRGKSEKLEQAAVSLELKSLRLLTSD